MFSRLSFFHTSFSSPHPFFTDKFVELFPLSEATLDTKLAQSAPALANLNNQPSVSNHVLGPALDTLLHRSTRVREPLIHLHDCHCFSTIVFLVETTSYKEANIDPLWQKVINDELQALEKTHILDYIDLPPSKKLIGCKWNYKIKTHYDELLTL